MRTASARDAARCPPAASIGHCLQQTPTSTPPYSLSNARSCSATNDRDAGTQPAIISTRAGDDIVAAAALDPGDLQAATPRLKFPVARHHARHVHGSYPGAAMLMEYSASTNVVTCLVVRSPPREGYMLPRVAEDLDDRARWQSANKQGAVRPGSDRSVDLAHRPAMASNIDADRPAHRRQVPKTGLAGLNFTRRGPTRPRLTWIAGGLIFAACFVVGLLLIKPARPPTAAMKALASATVSDLKTLMAAVKAAGLRGTPDVKGAIDTMTRVDNTQIILKGWTAEIGGSNEPLTVMAFVDGRNSLMVETSGGRRQIASALGLSDAAAADISFEGRLKCGKGQKLIVVAVARNDVYGQFGSRTCP